MRSAPPRTSTEGEAGTTDPGSRPPTRWTCGQSRFKWLLSAAGCAQKGSDVIVLSHFCHAPAPFDSLIAIGEMETNRVSGRLGDYSAMKSRVVCQSSTNSLLFSERYFEKKYEIGREILTGQWQTGQSESFPQSEIPPLLSPRMNCITNHS